MSDVIDQRVHSVAGLAYCDQCNGEELARNVRFCEGCNKSFCGDCLKEHERACPRRRRNGLADLDDDGDGPLPEAEPVAERRGPGRPRGRATGAKARVAEADVIPPVALATELCPGCKKERTREHVTDCPGCGARRCIVCFSNHRCPPKKETDAMIPELPGKPMTEHPPAPRPPDNVAALSTMVQVLSPFDVEARVTLLRAVAVFFGMDVYRQQVAGKAGGTP